MKDYSKHNKAGLLVAVIVGAVLLIAAVTLAAQRSFLHKVKSIQITTSNGPVSPEFQQTNSVLITKDSCTLTTTKTLSNQTTTTNCQPKTDHFNDLQAAVNSYGVIDKIISSNANATELLGGKTFNIKITLQNGDSFTTDGNLSFQNSIQPFLDQISQYYVGLDQVGF